MMQHEPVLILDSTAIDQKLNRLAYQIYEQNFEEDSLVICGIAERGFLVAQRIYDRLKDITPFQLTLTKVHLDKDDLLNTKVRLEPEIKDLKDKAVILCDDVLYTGKTLAYAAMPFLDAGAKKLQCLVLVHRNHLTFPIQPTYIGLSLATTSQEHVLVNFEGEESVYLR